MSKPQVKEYCNKATCCFKEVSFNTFSYMFCTECKEEVSVELMDRKNRKEIEVSNNHKGDDTDYDIFNFWQAMD